MLAPDRWEQGSDFHWFSYQSGTAPSSPWDGDCRLYGSGRDAFRALLMHGQMARGWKRLWIPSYFCQEVASSFLSTGIEVAVYPKGPEQPAFDLNRMGLQPGDVLLRVSLFGLDALRDVKGLLPGRVETIEDYTHDPWSAHAFASHADWCLVSLRKVLPIPDGGVVWSPLGHSLPPLLPVTPEREQASLARFTAMVLKGLYLEGRAVEKETFRNLALSGERRIASGPVSGMSEWAMNLLRTFPVDAWRESRRANHEILSAELADVPGVRVLQPEDAASTCPFSGILVFSSPGRRAFVREELIASRVYPAILWSLDNPVVRGIPPEDVDFSRRMLSIHCDMRYSRSDMERVAALVRTFGDRYNPREMG